ncbi:MAG TPA: flagellar export chaperone FliS [Terriglobales bacterium]|nr:flagellar export chaperone FliS [Terriglobales bacterium]
MKRSETEQAYVRAAVGSSDPVTLVILLFDTLIGDLRNAIAAIDAGDIEKRCADIKHGFLVLQQLEEFVDLEKGGQAAVHFTSFYSSVRSKVLEGHMKVSAEILQRQIELLLDVRQAWQQVASHKAPSTAANSPAASIQAETPGREQETAVSWTA